MMTNNTLLIISLLSLFFLCQLGWAQAQPKTSDGSVDGLSGANFNKSFGILFVALVAALFCIGFYSVCISRWIQVPGAGPGSGTRGILPGLGRASRGLDSSIIESFPTFDYAVVKTAKIGKSSLECAVCLTEFEDDDTLRLIPKCDHVFHPECIDPWLAGHTTCPVCRADLTEPVEFDFDTITPDDTVLEVIDLENINEGESMEQPLNGRVRRSRSMVKDVTLGRSKWMEKLTRSLSTGHVAIENWENMERFTLRLPNEVRKQIMSGKLGRSKSLVLLPREGSTRRGYRAGRRSQSVRSDQVNIGWVDRWVFSLAPPFIAKTTSVKSQKNVNSGSTRGGSLRGSI